MTLGVLVQSLPSPPVPCTVDVIFRPPYLKMDGDKITEVQNRTDGRWHSSETARQLRLRGGVARGDYSAAFPTLPAAFYNPAGAVTAVIETAESAARLLQYLNDIRREVQCEA